MAQIFNASGNQALWGSSAPSEIASFIYGDPNTVYYRTVGFNANYFIAMNPKGSANHYSIMSEGEVHKHFYPVYDSWELKFIGAGLTREEVITLDKKLTMLEELEK